MRDTVHEFVTVALDVLGLVLIAAGLGVIVGRLVGPGSGLIVAGVAVLAGRWWADRARAGAPVERSGERL
ncbi:hypothetical protein [Micromonospora sp. RTGN7]|uniref:hypothetical protein n=1 Tax=Micromonospora sp. RTGN7 TaxID=3016526 RepID=UPI0029FF2B52|nr:hypothetical protein [Micromonospora sp. RTGN7]